MKTSAYGQSLWQSLRLYTSNWFDLGADFVDLASLEAKRAAISFATILALLTAGLMTILVSWFFIILAISFLFITLGLGAISAALLAAFINILALIPIALLVKRHIHNLQFNVTRQQLRLLSFQLKGAPNDVT